MPLVVLARNWWALVARGVVAILFGVVAFVWPGVSLTALVLLFAAFALADGILALVLGVRGLRRDERWGAFLVQGMLGIGIAVVTVLWPAITALALLFLVAAWAVLIGVLEIVAAVRLRREIRGEWLLGLAGAASIAFGVILVAYPGAGILALLWLVAAYAIVLGILLVWLGVRLRGWLRHPPGLEGAPRPA